MSIDVKKHHKCPEHRCEGTLIVDVETEKIPRTDGSGNTSYYCFEGQHVFSVSRSGEATIEKTSKLVIMVS